ncbi:signal peptidase I [Gemmata sp. SH-PL17]|uniref:S26 family signal peptidase n=1 Tax=Gemmata sp. SH-PL17 TaxID=1630693 RepID=UPI0004BAE5DB|nr:S26 family signal peptidase [Gemmata sp. SH-PL17]AMV26162.1 signal peptidase I [Gemmata sp. SH-PL17]
MQWKIAPANKVDDTPATDFEALKAQKPSYIDNFLGYNVGRSTGAHEQSWVGDLCLECEAEITAGAEVAIDLSKGADRFRATFGNGKVTLTRSGPKAGEMGSKPCKVTAGTYKLRFANVDARLWVWVDGKRIDFGAEADYEPTQLKESEYEHDDQQKQGWVRANDIEAPAKIGAKGQVTAIRHLKLQRDIYYTWSPPGTQSLPSDFNEADIFYVQPGHYFCMGDNSAHSSDSREWGVVPDRLMLGKAVFVFFPVALDWKLGWPPVRFNPEKNRVGFIK